jgi:dienelactone hydrolase
MKAPMLRILLAAVLFACLPVHAAGAPTGPATADFFRNPAYSAPALSPDGRFVAIAKATGDKRTQLAVLDIGANQLTIIVTLDDHDIADVRWINKERIVFRARNELFAVNRDGSLYKQLNKRLPYNAHLMPPVASQDSNEIIVSVPKLIDMQNIAFVDLMRVNTIERTVNLIKREGNEREWLLDARGEPRLSRSVDQGNIVTAWRNPATGKWETLFQHRMYDDNAAHPIGFAPDGTLYVAARAGADKSALYRYDLLKRKLDGAPVASIEGHDFDGQLVFTGNALAGVHYKGDTDGTHWLDPKYEALQNDVDALLPDAVNTLTLPQRAETANLIVSSYSDRQPARYYLYDSASKKLRKLADSYPEIRSEQMGRQAMVRYKARDGLDIPAYVTLPTGKAPKNLPMVVLPYAAPLSRGNEWGWDPVAQFLASRGYAVLSPQFRGTTGYGSKFFRAGWKQWGLAMQDDLADGAKWAIAEGLADPARICLVGRNYGGYAALMGLIKDPALFQCGVSQDGYTDFKLLYTGRNSSAFSDLTHQFGLPLLVGDLEQDAAQLEQTSPLHQAARLKRPLLMGYATTSTNIDYMSEKFLDAAKPGNPALESVEYHRDSKGWYEPKNRIDFWNRVEQFLIKHIGQ